MPRVLRSILIASLVILTACSSFHIKHDFDPAADFGSFRTYAWSPDPPILKGDIRLLPPETRLMIVNAIDDQMVRSGLTRVEDADVDVWVTYAVTLSVRLTERDLQGNYGLPNSWQTDTNWTPSGFSRGATTTVEFNEGTLLISLVEPETRQLIWRASAEAEVHTERSPERRRSRINSAVGDMFRGYPPRIR